jgi:hypothetical protein
LKRREFLGTASLGALAGPFGLALPGVSVAAARRAVAARELAADVVVIGGGLGGCAAALAAARSGATVLLTEETDWIGGQLTQQAVPPDEHPWIESFGCTQSYRDLREGIREYYRRHYPLSAAARGRENLNPGNGRVSRLCHEPRVALAVLYEMLAPHMSGGRVRLLLEHRAVAADVEGDRVRAVHVRHVSNGTERVLHASHFIDATELGDLLPLTATEYVTGFESQKQTGEMHAPAEARPDDIQAVTCCFAMDYLPGEDHTLERPAEYDFWRAYVPELVPPWPGPLLSWQTTHPITLKERTLLCDPVGEPAGKSKGVLWLYRRIADRSNFAEGTYAADISLVNWPQNDYWLGSLYARDGNPDPGRVEQHTGRAKQLSLSLLFWMQTEAPRPDGGTGWPGLRLRRDVVGTGDGLAKYPYIREARRIRAEFTVLEQHVGTEARSKLTGKPRDELTAEPFFDSVGVGSYRIDLHPSTGGRNYLDIGSLRFQIPLGALLPQRVENLLPAAKNLGVTHITNGCYRLHPVEWNIGEAAGMLAAYCVRRRCAARQVRSDRRRLEDFQRVLRSAGVELDWPKVSPR